MLYKPVVPFGELIFQHTRVLAADRVESVVLRGYVNGFFRFLPLCALIDKGKLYAHACVKVVEEVAPVFKNGGLIVAACKLIVYILKRHAL